MTKCLSALLPDDTLRDIELLARSADDPRQARRDQRGIRARLSDRPARR
jgi:hypothetical protein